MITKKQIKKINEQLFMYSEYICGARMINIDLMGDIISECMNEEGWIPVDLKKTRNRILQHEGCKRKNILVTCEMENGVRYTRGVTVYNGFIQQDLKHRVVAVMEMPESYEGV